jgi:hypothetical protein
MALDYSEKERRSGELAWRMWWNRIRACQRFRQEYLFGERNWERYYNFYKILLYDEQEEYDHDLSADNPPDRIKVPIITSTILTIMPFLIKEKAEYFLDPKRPQDVVNIMLKSKVLNDEFHRKEIQDQLEMSAFDGGILGHGWAKSGFTRKVDQAKTKAAGNINYDDMIEDESINGKRVDPRNMWFDYNASSKNLDTARYVIERYHKYFVDIVENTFYKSSVREKIADGYYKPTPKDSLNSVYRNTDNMAWYSQSDFWDYESECGIMYEVWDSKFDQVLYFMEGVPEPLQVIDNPYPYLKGKKFPYMKMDFIYRPNEFYGMGIPEFIEHQAMELARHRTSAFDHRRRYSMRQMWIDENQIDPEEAEKVADPDYDYIFTQGPNAMGVIDDVPLPSDYAMIEAIIKQDILEFTGADNLARGQNLQSRATAQEVQVRTNILGLKLDQRIAAIDKMFLTMGKHLSAHIGAQYTKSQIVRMRGPQGEYWVVVSNEDLIDELDMRMQTVSAPKRNPEVEGQQKIMFVTQILPQLLALIQGGVLPGNAINFVELVKFGLEGFERVDIGRFFPSALNPVIPLQEISAQEFGQQIQGGQQAPASDQSDLIRGISSGNFSGLQLAGGIQ